MDVFFWEYSCFPCFSPLEFGRVGLIFLLVDLFETLCLQVKQP